MTCPRCDIEMEPGAIIVHGTFGRLLLYGLSSQPLWWRPASGRDQKLLEPRRPKRALRCGRCSMLIIP